MKLGRVKQPPGGWHFPVAPGIELKAGTETLLQNQIHEYRLRNGIPPGDIEREIDDYYCSKWPDACHKEPQDYAPNLRASEPAREPILNRVTRWVTALISRMPQGGYPMVSMPDATKRAMICASCPANVPWKTGCPGCTNNVSALLIQLRQLRRLPHDGLLYGCLIGGWANESAVHLGPEQTALTDRQKGELPDRCWRKTL